VSRGERPITGLLLTTAPVHRDYRHLSLVDAVSFVVMCERRLDEVFAFDRHFADEGFTLLN
jgi:predicted nucleic acid-binding protein